MNKITYNHTEKRTTGVTYNASERHYIFVTMNKIAYNHTEKRTTGVTAGDRL